MICKTYFFRPDTESQTRGWKESRPCLWQPHQPHSPQDHKAPGFHSSANHTQTDPEQSVKNPMRNSGGFQRQRQGHAHRRPLSCQFSFNLVLHCGPGTWEHPRSNLRSTGMNLSQEFQSPRTETVSFRQLPDGGRALRELSLSSDGLPDGQQNIWFSSNRFVIWRQVSTPIDPWNLNFKTIKI